MSHLFHSNFSLDLSRRGVLRQAGGVLATSLCASAVLAQTPTAAKLPRLVTISGAITEVVYLLGAKGQLVGTDTTSIFPAAALTTPKVGYMRQLSAEGLLSLRPDAVIASTEAGPPVVIDQIRSAGVRVELVESDHSWGEVQRKVAAVGRAANRVAQATALQTRLDADWAAVQKQVAAYRGKKPRVLFIMSQSGSPRVAGLKTAADSMVTFLGGINVMADFEGYRPMTAEAMAVAAPDVILTSTQGIEGLGGVDKFWARPELALTPAFRRKALVQGDLMALLGFGPRLPQIVRELHPLLVQA